MDACMLAFPNTYNAIMGETALLEAGVDVRVVPVPSSVSAGCGICLQVGAADLGRCRALLTESRVELESCFSIVQEQGKREYQLLG